MITVGSELPSVSLSLKGVDVDLKNLFREEKGLLLGVVGAFNPTCSKFICEFRDAHATLAETFGFIGCIAVNDSYVLKAWARKLAIRSQITFISDVNAALTRSLGLEQVAANQGYGNVLCRCQRFALIATRSRVVWLEVGDNACASNVVLSAVPLLLSRLGTAAQLSPEGSPSSAFPKQLSKEDSLPQLVLSQKQEIKSKTCDSGNRNYPPPIFQYLKSYPSRLMDQITFEQSNDASVPISYNLEICSSNCLQLVPSDDESLEALPRVRVDMGPGWALELAEQDKKSTLPAMPRQVVAEDPALYPSTSAEGEDSQAPSPRITNFAPVRPVEYRLSKVEVIRCNDYALIDGNPKIEMRLTHKIDPDSAPDDVIDGASERLIVSFCLDSGGRDSFMAALLAAISEAQFAPESFNEPQKITSANSFTLSHLVYQDCEFIRFDDKSSSTTWLIGCHLAYASQAQVKALDRLLECGYSNKENVGAEALLPLPMPKPNERQRYVKAHVVTI